MKVYAVNKVFLELTDIEKSYGCEKVLRGCDLSLKQGEIITLTGASGCGKSTLLHIAGLLDTPMGGDVLIDNVNATNLNINERARLRLEKIGFIYQQHNLMSEFSVIENVLYPMWVFQKDRKKAMDRALDLLEKVGMIDLKDKSAGLLSGGQSQRVAIARALANKPKIILADEPTGNLDEQNSHKVWMLLSEQVKNQNCCLLCATHDLNLAKLSSASFEVWRGKVKKQIF